MNVYFKTAVIIGKNSSAVPDDVVNIRPVVACVLFFACANHLQLIVEVNHRYLGWIMQVKRWLQNVASKSFLIWPSKKGKMEKMAECQSKQGKLITESVKTCIAHSNFG